MEYRQRKTLTVFWRRRPVISRPRDGCVKRAQRTVLRHLELAGDISLSSDAAGTDTRTEG